jgi:hypothetical protein
MSDRIWQGLWWITMNTLKLLLYVFVAFIYLLAARDILLETRSYLNRHETWVLFETPLLRGKFLVPQEIASAKDCEQFFKWQYENIPLVMHGKCPWYKYTPIYEVKLGELELKIPRKYLLLPASTDRHTRIISTRTWIYPSMELEGRTLSTDSFWFTLLDDADILTLQDYFWGFLQIDPKREKYEIISLGLDEPTQMGKYRFDVRATTLASPQVFHTFVYTNDDINNPQDFAVCGEKAESYCHSVFQYKGIYVKYMFNRHLLNKPNDIKSAIIKLIQEWETN